MMIRKLFVAVAVVGAVAPAHAASFSYSEGSRSAEVTFTKLSATQLQVTLTNTFHFSGTLTPSDCVTAVFWDMAGNPALSKTGGSAKIAIGSTVLNSAFDNTSGLSDLSDVGTEYAFRQSSPGGLSPLTQDYGLSSSGLGIFGVSDRFDTSKPNGVRSSPADPDGINFALAPLGSYGFNGGTSSKPLIKNSVVFILTGSGLTDAEVNSISNVRLQWGTALTEPHGDPPPPPVPEPASVVLLSMGGLGLLGVVWRMRRLQVGAI